MIYLAGRIFQLIGLLALPSAIWVGQIGHSERGMIAIFAASSFVFLLGYFLNACALIYLYDVLNVAPEDAGAIA